jgi:hypothetical protein
MLRSILNGPYIQLNISDKEATIHFRIVASYSGSDKPNEHIPLLDYFGISVLL